MRIIYKNLSIIFSKPLYKASLYSIFFSILFTGFSIKYIEFFFQSALENPTKIINLFLKEKRAFLEKNSLFIVYKNHLLYQGEKKEKLQLQALSTIKYFPKLLAKINNKNILSENNKNLMRFSESLKPNKLGKRKDTLRIAHSAIERTNIKDSLEELFVNVSGLIYTPGDKKLEGHFEVGLYESINPYNEPIGPPLAQSILKQGETVFNLNIPINTKGYLFAFYSGDEYSKKWFYHPGELRFKKGVRQAKIQILAQEDYPKTTMNKQEFSFLQGRVYEIFSQEGRKTLKDVLVRLRGTNLTTQTDEEGHFKLKLPQANGQFLIEFLKYGYSPRVEEVYIRKGPNLLPAPVELIHIENIDRMAEMVGLTQSPEKSILIVKARGENKEMGLPGISMQLSLSADGPYYFSQYGEIDNRIENTSFDGKAIFFNVKKGVGFLETFELIYKSFSFCEQKLHGKVLNPIQLTEEGEASPIIGARVRISGSSQWIDSDLFGYFELPNSLYACDSKIMLEFSTNGYYRHRYQLKIPSNRRKKVKPINLYAFPINYINNMANSVNVKLNPNTGIIIGQTGLEKRLRMDTLLDHTRLSCFYRSKLWHLCHIQCSRRAKYTTWT